MSATLEHGSIPSTIFSSIEQDLIRDEGWTAKPYKDSRGFLTIGIGHNLDSEGLCKEAISAQLRHDLAQAASTLDALLPSWRKSPEAVQRVLLNLAFNLGGKLRGWPIFLSQIERGEYRNAAANIRSNKVYCSQVGQRAERLAILLSNVVK
jgi:lysozyme